jgi:glycosyltransferase involved in cell wall biosynthesis
MNPLVSVGLPCYNRPESLKRAIECILNQTYTNLEIIISNDASPNPVIKPMLDEYAKRDQHIRLFHQPVDLQCYGNYDFVLSQATGEYFMYAQDDDLWEPDCIELLVRELIHNQEYAFAVSTSQYIEENGNPWQVFTFNNKNILSLIFGERAPFIWMGLWRTQILKQFDYPIGEVHGKDIIIAAEALLSCPFGYVDKLLYSKTLYHNKAIEFIEKKPFCHFEMYGTLLSRIATSKYVKNKSWLIVLIPISCAAIVKMYLAAVLFKLPLNHPIRKCVRSIVR